MSIVVVVVMVVIVVILIIIDYYEKLSHVPLVLGFFLVLWMFYTVVAYILVWLGIPI